MFLAIEFAAVRLELVDGELLAAVDAREAGDMPDVHRARDRHLVMSIVADRLLTRRACAQRSARNVGRRARLGKRRRARVGSILLSSFRER